MTFSDTFFPALLRSKFRCKFRFIGKLEKKGPTVELGTITAYGEIKDMGSNKFIFREAAMRNISITLLENQTSPTGIRTG